MIVLMSPFVHDSAVRFAHSNSLPTVRTSHTPKTLYKFQTPLLKIEIFMKKDEP